MTFKEFTFWLEGFKESIDGVPTKEQWELIQEKFSEIEEQRDDTFDPIQFVPPPVYREKPNLPPWAKEIWYYDPYTLGTSIT